MEARDPHRDPGHADIRMEDAKTLSASGTWTLERLADIERRLSAILRPGTAALVLKAGAIESMDSAGAWLLLRTVKALEGSGAKVEVVGLRPEFAELAKMVAAGAAGIGPAVRPRSGRLEAIGRATWSELRSASEALSFIGENAAVLARSLARPGRVRWRALLSALRSGGFNALPITGLLSFLMGIVIAYQAAAQLRTFGANIFIVDLIGISVLREIAPLVTAIIVAGRSGSAYTAEIGTMQVTEELDALRTLGISPLEMLVLPKTLALVIALPLLTVYADVLGVFGGMLMARNQLDVSFVEFLTRFDDAVPVKHYLIGVSKAPVFAVIISLVGCYQGFQVTGGADVVGRHTTISVVQGIFLVIVFDAFFSVLFNWVGL